MGLWAYGLWPLFHFYFIFRLEGDFPSVLVPPPNSGVLPRSPSNHDPSQLRPARHHMKSNLLIFPRPTKLERSGYSQPSTANITDKHRKKRTVSDLESINPSVATTRPTHFFRHGSRRPFRRRPWQGSGKWRPRAGEL